MAGRIDSCLIKITYEIGMGEAACGNVLCMSYLTHASCINSVDYKCRIALMQWWGLWHDRRHPYVVSGAQKDVGQIHVSSSAFLLNIDLDG